MSPKLPRVTAARVLQALKRAGWYEHHQTGSHLFLRHPIRPGMRVDIPMHRGKTLKLKTLVRIVDSAGLTVEEFADLLGGAK
ncbi:MAG: type II toxin-antitoxin system HicA family toxin [Chloroflexi bacterium]|nr:type II toxin-antitoxin system HicA family toxin [Chloroflexota bacterium]